MKTEVAMDIKCQGCGKFLGATYPGSHSTIQCTKCGTWWVYDVSERGLTLLRIPPQEPARATV